MALLVIMRGRMVLKGRSVPFEVARTGKGLSLRIELPGNRSITPWTAIALSR